MPAVVCRCPHTRRSLHILQLGLVQAGGTRQTVTIKDFGLRRVRVASERQQPNRAEQLLLSFDDDHDDDFQICDKTDNKRP